MAATFDLSRLVAPILILLLGATMLLTLRLLHEKKGEKAFSVLAFGLAALPLPLYPFVLLANVMSIAGVWQTPQTAAEWFSTVIFVLFMVCTTLYPAVYFLSFYGARYLRSRQKSTRLVILLPLISLLFIVALFCCMTLLGP